MQRDSACSSIFLICRNPTVRVNAPGAGTHPPNIGGEIGRPKFEHGNFRILASALSLSRERRRPSKKEARRSRASCPARHASATR